MAAARRPAPFTVNNEGCGPAWANSLFEDNAEYGFGMHVAYTQRREKLANTVEALKAHEWTVPELKEACQAWLDGMLDANLSPKPPALRWLRPVRKASRTIAIATPANWRRP